jgi:hypothetical protein
MHSSVANSWKGWPVNFFDSTATVRYSNWDKLRDILIKNVGCP